MVFLRQWTNEKILDSLKTIGSNNTITNKLLIVLSKEKKICNPSLIRQYFGTLENACKQANVKYKNNKGVGYWTKERIYIVGKELSKKYKTLTREELFNLAKKRIICHPAHIQRRVGSLKPFFKKIGINYLIQSYEDLYGKEGAVDKSNKIKLSNTKWNKKNIINCLRQIYKENNNVQPKDLDYYSREKKICSNNVIRRVFGTYKNLFQEAKVPYKKYYWSKIRIINSLKKLDKTYGPLCKSDINKIYSKKGLICRAKCIRDVIGNLDIAVKLANIEFIEPQDKGYDYNGKVGKTESNIIKKIKNNKRFIRQYRLQIDENVYFVDAFDPVDNIAYEIDGKYHSYDKQKIFDKLRENKIRQAIGCNFVRLKDGW